MLSLSLRQYEYLVAVGNAGSMSAAARTLAVSQPSLSVAIAHIEARLGRALFARARGGPLRQTVHGREVIAAARDLLERAARLEDPDAVHGNRSRPLAIGFFEDLAPCWLARTLAGARRELTGTSPAASVTGFAELTAGLRTGALDLALTYDLGLDASFERRTVERVSPVAFVAVDDPLAGAASVTLRKLATRPLVLFDDGLSIQHVLRLFAAKGLKPAVSHRAASLEVMRTLAAHGEGVGIGYTRPPGATSYDGTPLATVRITDREAIEPIVLARAAGRDDGLPLQQLVRMMTRMVRPE